MEEVSRRNPSAVVNCCYIIILTVVNIDNIIDCK